MKIECYSCLEGARKAGGVTVIIDVFRAGNTILSCFNQGAESVIPVGKLDRAYELKRQNPGYILAGERNSLPPEGFDFGNSPVEASKMNLEGQSVIMTTSAGTQGIVHAGAPTKILIATFANEKPVVEYIHSIQPEKVSLVAMGFNTTEKAEEDEWYAWYLEQKLTGENPDFQNIKSKLLHSKGAQRLKGINKQDDLEFCLQLNTFDFVVEYDFQRKVLVKVR